MDTKYIFADALKTCMKKSPYEKITVKDITDTCNLSRQTFYRHFLDKGYGSNRDSGYTYEYGLCVFRENRRIYRACLT